MPVPYLAVGDSILASQLNALTQELDDQLKCLCGGKSFIFSVGSIPMGKEFYFGTPASRKYYAASGEYTHSTYESVAVGLALTGYDLDKDLALVDSGDYATANQLNDSLEAHGVLYGGRKRFFWWQDQITTQLYQRERYRKLHVAEIIIEGLSGAVLKWDEKWDKYHFIRFHNVDLDYRIIDLPNGQSITLEPWGIQAVRRSYPHGDVWDTRFQYVWPCYRGDSLLWKGVDANNVAGLGVFHEYIDAMQNVFNARCVIDPTYCWNGESLLPAPLKNETRLGQCVKHIGRIISFAESDTSTAYAIDATPRSWDELEAGIGGVRAVFTGGDLSIEANAPTPVDAVGVGTTLLGLFPVTLPYSVTISSLPLSAVDTYTSTETISATWSGGTVNTTYDHDVLGSWSNSGTGDWVTLADKATLTKSDASLVTQPAVTWKSDGLRILFCSQLSVVPASGLVPGDMDDEYACSFTSNGFVVQRASSAYDWGDDWRILSRTKTRKLSPYDGVTDFFGQVTYYGHPDFDGTMGLPEGIDWEEGREVPEATEAIRGEAVQADPVDTQTLPVIPLADALDRIVSGSSEVNWYASRRTALLSGDIEEGDKQKLLRIPILARHYNHVAQRLNAVIAISPFNLGAAGANATNFIDLLRDGTIPLGFASERPEDFYAEVASASSYAASIGIPVSSYTIQRTTLPSYSTLYYVTLTDVKEWAASKGMNFFLRRISSARRYDETWLGSSSGAWLRSDDSGDVAGYVDFGNDHAVSGQFLLTSDYDLHPATHGTTYTVSALARIEEAVGQAATPPAGWRWENDDRVLLTSRPSIAWASGTVDPTFATSISTVPAFTVDGKPYSAYRKTVDLPTWITPDNLRTSVAPGASGDPRETWELRLINRFLIVRS